MFTRQGHSPGLEFPRIIGIELLGTVASECHLPIGTLVASCMGGLGRQIPGSYAEYACVSKSFIHAFPETKLPIATLAALPEMLQTTYGSLAQGLELQKGESILIRGATSSIGIAAIQLSRYLGASRVAGTSRSESRFGLLREYGADEVYVDDGKVADAVGEKKFDKVLELVGTSSLKDSLRCVKPKGMVCMTGIQGGEWELKGFSPLIDLSERRRLTAYAGDAHDFMATPWEDLVKAVEDGKLKVPSRAFTLDQIQEVHEILERGGGGQKMVVMVDT